VRTAKPLPVSAGEILFRENAAAGTCVRTLPTQRNAAVAGPGGLTVSVDTQPWCEDGYCVKTLLSAAERIDMYRLRARVFCRELHWVGEDGYGLESDECDRQCSHLAVIDPAGRVVATARVATSSQQWMLDGPFANFLPANGSLHRGGKVVEISRLATDPAARNARLTNGYTVADLLYKSLFNYCMSRSQHLAYAVVSAAMWRHMRMHKLIGTTVGLFRVMADGVRAGLVCIDWKEFAAVTPDRDPVRWDWYATWQPTPEKRLTISGF
jgi:N-acyl-L-homoserine lactone synthetase